MARHGPWLAACLAALLLALPTRAATPLRLGVLPALSARMVVQAYQPLQAYLQSALGQPVEIGTAVDFPGFYRQLQARDYQLAVCAPHIARLLQKEAGWTPLASFLPEQRAVLAAPRRGGPAGVSELAGGRIAVIDRNALLVDVMLHDLRALGLEEGRDFQIVETRNHASSVLALDNGLARAMVTRHQGFLSAAERERLAVLRESAPVAGWVILAAPDQTAEVRARYKRLLLDFPASPTARALLDTIGYTDLREADEAALRRLDPFLDKARRGLGARP